ncbi:hypothetical protein M9H77_08167 [Catharanthus roseus]|uniref:Uncharacterized protein n=1 Tax=Catharanthus roseus TaxID=4058 RepID=A0ACC0BX98_CATRO|nr:hypothetical protein M9H77_08167 [Catharanthus roseus]
MQYIYIYIYKRVILALTNDIVDNVNSDILSLLSVGVPIILLCNINQSKCLCNGIRLFIKRLGENVIEVEAITRTSTRLRHYINRIDMSPLDSEWPFSISRVNIRKYCCILAKSCILSLSIDVAISRVTSHDGSKFYIDNNEKCENNIVKNVVYSEIFSNIHIASGEIGIA